MFPLFFLSLVSICLILIIIAANGPVHSFQDNKTFNFNHLHQKLQRKHKSPAACLLPQSRREKLGAVILEMKDRRQWSEKNKNHADWNSRMRSVHKQLSLDALRVRAIQDRIHKLVSTAADESSGIPLTTGMEFETLNYIVTLGLGSQNMSVIVDTGSDLTWVQCGPCDSCYNQQGPLFHPSTSPSYQSIPCNSTTCQSLGFSGPCGTGASSPPCNYVVNYGDGSYTTGELGVDELSLGDTSVSSFVFGCGRNNKGLFGVASGLMGLGRSDLSLISQTNSSFGGVFSYCLPSPEGGTSGSLVMGSSSAFKNVSPISYTRMVLDPQLSSFYILNLTGMSVGGVGLEVEAPGGLGKGRMVIIDSGTVITRLAPSIYGALKAEFLKQFSGAEEEEGGFSILDTCFNLSGEVKKIPSMRMEFDQGKGEMNVDVSGMLYRVKEDGSRVCLAIASTSSSEDDGSRVGGIIGNYQQRNQRVIYDTVNQRVGFAAEPCSFP